MTTMDEDLHLNAHGIPENVQARVMPHWSDESVI